MPLWQLLGLLGIGALGVGVLASSNARAASATAEPGTPGMPSALNASDSALLNQVFQAAMDSENNTTVLQLFSKRLRAASQTSFADAIDAKVARLQRFVLSSAVLTRVTLPTMGGPTSS